MTTLPLFLTVAGVVAGLFVLFLCVCYSAWETFFGKTWGRAGW